MTPALTRVLEALEAERLAPVPRADRVVAVDAADLAAVLEHVWDYSKGRMPHRVVEAYDRLDKVARRYASPGAETAGAA